MLQSPADRSAMLLDLDRAEVAGYPRELRCHYLDPSAEALETMGQAPAARWTVDDVAAVPVAVGTRIESITRYDGRRVGPFAVRTLEPDGGGFVQTQLEELSA